jgi:ABC-type thiamin/hydroxymethylpyrimidine transport system permease subunit
MSVKMIIITAVTALIGAIVFIWYQDYHNKSTAFQSNYKPV